MLTLLHPHVDLLVLFAVGIEPAELELILFVLGLVSLADGSCGKSWTTLRSFPFFRLLLSAAVLCACSATRFVLSLLARLSGLWLSVW